MTRGFFITFEGGEGVGKTTQIQMLSDELKKSGHDVVVTREPGGTPQAEVLRNLLSDKTHGEEWTPEAEAMLLFAARAMHIRDVIKPALEAGKTIISDRYIDSTRAYQGYLQGLGHNFIQLLEDKVVGEFVPDLTLVLDLPVDVAMARVQKRGAEDHYDNAEESVHETLRNAFLDIAEKEPTRCHVFNADQNENILAADILSVVQERLS